MATKNETKKEQEQKKSAPRGEKVSVAFKQAIKAYLDRRAADDALFAKTCVKEMAEEGTMMHHCVYANGYYDHKKHPYSLILSAKDKEGHRLETIELNTKTWRVMQSRGLLNRNTPFHDQIVRLVEQNIGLFKKVA